MRCYIIIAFILLSSCKINKSLSKKEIDKSEISTSSNIIDKLTSKTETNVIDQSGSIINTHIIRTINKLDTSGIIIETITEDETTIIDHNNNINTSKVEIKDEVKESNNTSDIKKDVKTFEDSKNKYTFGTIPIFFIILVAFVIVCVFLFWKKRLI